MKRVICAIVILLVLLVVLSALLPYHPPSANRGLRQKRKTMRPKRVRFAPVVAIGHAGGRKSDRYNAKLRDTIAKNSLQAVRVGGAKQLARLSLHEAAES